MTLRWRKRESNRWSLREKERRLSRPPDRSPTSSPSPKAHLSERDGRFRDRRSGGRLMTTDALVTRRLPTPGEARLATINLTESRPACRRDQPHLARMFLAVAGRAPGDD